MRAQFLKPNILKIKTNNKANRRSRAPIFVIMLMFVLQIVLTTLTPMYTQIASAASKDAPALNTAKELGQVSLNRWGKVTTVISKSRFTRYIR
jgi:hypothetical protein